nr:unnamed protein product [Digitaria exilis]
MKRSAATITFVSAVLVAPCHLLHRLRRWLRRRTLHDMGGRVPQVPLPRPAASGDQHKWYQLCQDTLKNGPNSYHVTFFVLMATRKALLRYDSAMSTINHLLQSATKPPPLLEHCKERYGKIMEQLPHCDFMKVKQEYYDAHLAVQSCLSELWSGYWSSPLCRVALVAMVAFQLGALLVDGK